MEDQLLDALHARWAEKHQKWLHAQEKKRARLNGDTEMSCGKKGKARRGGGKKR